MKLLVIAPHPDDEVLGCGGTIRRFVREGHTVQVAIVTKGWEPLFPKAQVEQVRDEARTANRRLGVADLTFMDLPVTKLAQMPQHELNGALNDLLDQSQPDWVFLPHRSDVHEDHRQIFDAAMVALRPLPQRLGVQRILCYETLSETHWNAPCVMPAFEPQVFIDISADLPAKLDAMRCYQSQLKPAPNARSLAAIDALARFRGANVHCEAAEAFVLAREILAARP